MKFLRSSLKLKLRAGNLICRRMRRDVVRLLMLGKLESKWEGKSSRICL